MKGKLHLVAGIVFVLLLAYDFFLWGGLSRSATLGPMITAASKREVSLAGFYLPVGRELTGWVGRDAAASLATRTFAPLEASLLANPAAAMDRLLTDMPMGPRLAYYGAPVVLLLDLLLWWRRPRGVHLVGRR